MANLTLNQINAYAQEYLRGIASVRISMEGETVLSPFAQGPMSIDLHATMARLELGKVPQSVTVALPGHLNDAGTLHELGRRISIAHAALYTPLTWNHGTGPGLAECSVAPCKLHIFTLEISFASGIAFTWNPRRKSFWQWLTGQKCPNEAYAPGEDGIPSCANAEQRERRRLINDPQTVTDKIIAMPDCSDLSDEELAEKVKTARLGEGVFAEVGVRKFRQQQEEEAK